MKFYKKITRKIKKLSKNMQFAIVLFFVLAVTAVASVAQLVNTSNFDLRQQAADDPGGGGLYAPTNTPTPTKLANGQLCQTSSQCQSNYCADGFCQPIQNQPSATPTVAKKPNYSTCSSNSECQSNICQASLCRPVPTATPIPGVPTHTPAPSNLGTCSTSVTCQNPAGCFCPTTCNYLFAPWKTSCGGWKPTPTPTPGSGGNVCPTGGESKSACEKYGDTCVQVNGCWQIQQTTCYHIYSCTYQKWDCVCGIGNPPINNQCAGDDYYSLTTCKSDASQLKAQFESQGGASVCEAGDSFCGTTDNVTVWTCNAQLGDWESSACQSGTTCVDGKCVGLEKRGIGEACNTSFQCETGLQCKANSNNQFQCLPNTTLSSCSAPCFSTSGCVCPSGCAEKFVTSYGKTCGNATFTPIPTRTPTPTPIIEQAYSTATTCANYHNNQIGCISHGCQYVATTNYSGTCGANYGKSTSPTCGVSSSGTCAGATLGSSCNNNTGLCARNPYADASDATCVCEVKNSVSRVEVSGGNTCPSGSVCICKTSGSFIESGQYCPRAVGGGQTCPADSPTPGCWCNTAFGRIISGGEQCYDRPEDVAKFVAEGVGLTAGIVALPVLPQVGTAGYVYSSIYGGAALTAAAQSGLVQNLLQPLSSPIVQNVVGNSNVQLWGARIVGAGLGALDAYGFASSGAPTSQMLSPYVFANNALMSNSSDDILNRFSSTTTGSAGITYTYLDPSVTFDSSDLTKLATFIDEQSFLPYVGGREALNNAAASIPGRQYVNLNQAISRIPSEPFAQLDYVSHGNVGIVAYMDEVLNGQQFAQVLVDNGLPRGCGMIGINIIACYSSTPATSGLSFVDDLQNTLDDLGYQTIVNGYDGGVYMDIEGTFQVGN